MNVGPPLKKLFLLTQTERRGYDTYDSVIVCALSDSEARNIHPNTIVGWGSRSWCSSPDAVQVQHVGYAKTNVPVGVVLASFNAG